MSLPDLAQQATPAGVDGAVITFWDGARIRPLAATGPWALAAVDAELVTGHGPITVALTHCRPVTVEDVTDQAPWPGFVDHTRPSGLAAVDVHVVGDTNFDTMGALAVYRRRPGPLSAAAAASIEHVAHLVTAELLTSPVTDILDHAPGGDATLSTASGILSERWSTTPDHALLLLRAHAFSTGRPLHAVATDVVFFGHTVPPPP